MSRTLYNYRACPILELARKKLVISIILSPSHLAELLILRLGAMNGLCSVAFQLLKYLSVVTCLLVAVVYFIGNENDDISKEGELLITGGVSYSLA